MNDEMNSETNTAGSIVYIAFLFMGIFMLGFTLIMLNSTMSSLDNMLHDTTPKTITGLYIAKSEVVNEDNAYTTYTIGGTELSIQDEYKQPDIIIGETYRVIWHRIDGQYPFVLIDNIKLIEKGTIDGR